jgi:hypothetical protein
MYPGVPGLETILTTFCTGRDTPNLIEMRAYGRHIILRPQSVSRPSIIDPRSPLIPGLKACMMMPTSASDI